MIARIRGLTPSEQAQLAGGIELEKLQELRDFGITSTAIVESITEVFLMAFMHVEGAQQAAAQLRELAAAIEKNARLADTMRPGIN